MLAVTDMASRCAVGHLYLIIIVHLSSEVRRDDEAPLVFPRPGYSGHRRSRPGRALTQVRGGNQTGDRSLVLGDRHRLARCKAVDKLCQACLGFLKYDRDHPEISRGPWWWNGFYQTS